MIVLELLRVASCADSTGVGRFAAEPHPMVMPSSASAVSFAMWAGIRGCSLDKRWESQSDRAIVMEWARHGKIRPSRVTTSLLRVTDVTRKMLVDFGAVSRVGPTIQLPHYPPKVTVRHHGGVMSPYVVSRLSG